MNECLQVLFSPSIYVNVHLVIANSVIIFFVIQMSTVGVRACVFVCGGWWLIKQENATFKIGRVCVHRVRVWWMWVVGAC